MAGARSSGYSTASTLFDSQSDGDFEETVGFRDDSEDDSENGSDADDVWNILDLDSPQYNDEALGALIRCEEPAAREANPKIPRIIVGTPDNMVTFEIPTSNPNHFVINPTDMSLFEARVTTQFLINQLRKYGESLTESNKEYEFRFKYPDSERIVNAKVEFTHDLAWYIDDQKPIEDRFAVIGKTKVGNSDQCVVSKVKGRLLPSAAGTLFYQSDKGKHEEQKWVARYETHTTNLNRQQAIAVYELAKKNPKLGMKHPMWTTRTRHHSQLGRSISIMRRLKNYNLAKVMRRDQLETGYLDKILKKTSRWDLDEITFLINKKKLKFSNLELLRLSRAIAIAYKEQVYDLGIMHRDIKAGNIMWDMSKGFAPEAITIFDYGYARRIGEKDHITCCGTPGYWAPEMIEDKDPTDNSCDIYSLGCTLALLGGDESAYKEYPETDPAGLLHACNRVFKLNQGTPDDFNQLLHQMVKRNPKERPLITAVIEEHDRIITCVEKAEKSPKTSPSSPLTKCR